MRGNQEAKEHQSQCASAGLHSIIAHPSNHPPTFSSSCLLVSSRLLNIRFLNDFGIDWKDRFAQQAPSIQPATASRGSQIIIINIYIFGNKQNLHHSLCEYTLPEQRFCSWTENGMDLSVMMIILSTA